MAKRRRPRHNKIYLCYRMVGDTLYITLAIAEYVDDDFEWVCLDGERAGSGYFSFWEVVPKQDYRKPKLVIYG